ncbi:MAG: DUF1080 domain-containing protein [Mangrovibacterium sp.]|nr:DUF1080 domain-containing protein [Mangrovibacterium sp.]
MKRLVFLLFSLSNITLFAQEAMPEMVPGMTEIWDPEVTVVTPGELPVNAPSDAIVLIGEGIPLGYEWTDGEGNAPQWDFEKGVVTVKKGSGTMKTKRVFKDFQLHVEWRTPSEVTGESQGRGNSGIFLQGQYEVQVLDNYNNRTYRNGQAGSIYKQHAPLVNACKAPGAWQAYDMIYTAPRFREDGTYFTPPTVTVLQNGVLVQNHVALRGPTLYIGIPEYQVRPHGDGPIVLQDHGNPVSYRNIWIREL